LVGEHGSWNRSVPVGYKVLFGAVPRRPGRGRPIGVTLDPRGARIVADDLSRVRAAALSRCASLEQCTPNGEKML
jgi:glucose/arabinose dehydrogenase